MIAALLIIFATFLWAVDTLIRYPLISSGFSAQSLVFFEHLLLFLIFLPTMLKKRQKYWSESVSTIFYFFIIGGLGSAVATVAFTKAFTMISPSLVILLQKLQPLVVVLLARIFLQEKIKKGFWTWAAVAIFGSLLISYNDIVPFFEEFKFSTALISRHALTGYLLAFISVVSWASSTVFGKKLTGRGFATTEIMAGRFFFGLMVMIPFVAFQKMPFWGNLDFLDTMGQIVLMVCISGILGMFVYYKGLKGCSAKLSSILELFFPLFAVSLNWIFLDQELDIIQLVGAGFLLLSSFMLRWKSY